MSYIYTRKANYYETDMMGIVHHSNHIRYFEEARIAFMHSIGCDVMQMERDGIIIPNVDAYARYYIPVRFSEEIDIEIRLSYFNGTKMEYTYTARNKNGETAAEGHTMHCNRSFEMEKLYEEDFEERVLSAEHPVVVDFYADWCGPCHMLSPILEELESKNDDFEFFKVNVDECHDLAVKYNVFSIPTVVIFKGGRTVVQSIGLKSGEEMQKILNGI